MIALSIIIGIFSYALFCGVSFGIIGKASGRSDCATCKHDDRTCYKSRHNEMVIIGSIFWPFTVPYTFGVLMFKFWNKEDK